MDRVALKNPYSNINVRSDNLIETEAYQGDELEAEFHHMQVLDRKGYNTSNQNFFES